MLVLTLQPQNLAQSWAQSRCLMHVYGMTKGKGRRNYSWLVRQLVGWLGKNDDQNSTPRQAQDSGIPLTLSYLVPFYLLPSFFSLQLMLLRTWSKSILYIIAFQFPQSSLHALLTLDLTPSFWSIWSVFIHTCTSIRAFWKWVLTKRVAVTARWQTFRAGMCTELISQQGH